MKALAFDIRTNSLYSIRIPFTWQSALIYPIPPPSAIIGMLANALQRYMNNRHPLEYLDQIEANIVWAGSRLLMPAVIKSYITSAIVKWEDTLGGKFTNALGRQFAYSREMQIAAIFKDNVLIEDLIQSIKAVPLTCGDSESPISLECEVKTRKVSGSRDKFIETEYPIPFNKDIEIIEGNGQVYWMHERCKKIGNKFPMVSYMLPIKEMKRILYPSSLRVKVSKEKVLKIEGIGHVIYQSSTTSD